MPRPKGVPKRPDVDARDKRGHDGKLHGRNLALIGQSPVTTARAAPCVVHFPKTAP